MFVLAQQKASVRALLERDSVLTVVASVLFAFPCWRALVERWAAAGQARFPGHADPAFYFSLAKNIATGRGPVIDYVWHFWVSQANLTHFGADYWMPLPSVLMALAMTVWGPTAIVGARVAVCMSLALAGTVWVLSRALGTPRWASLAASCTAFLALPVAHFSVQTDASLFYSVFVLLSLSFGIQSRDGREWRVLVAGLFSGCAHLCRNDGLLVLVSLIGAHLLWQSAGLRRRIALASVGHLVVLAPYAVLLFRSTGRLLPAHGALPFVIDYEDLYRLPPGPSFADLVRMGLWDALLLRQRASVDRAFDFVRDVLGLPGLVLIFWAGVFGGARLAVRADTQGICSRLRQTVWVLPGLYAVSLFSFHATVTPVASAAGAYSRSLPAVVGVLLVALIAGLRTVRSPPVATLFTVGLLVAWPWFQVSKGLPLRVVRDNNEVAVRLEGVQRTLDQESSCFRAPIVVMTRDPWELTELTGYRSVQIPNGDSSAIVSTAARFQVTHLIPSQRRRALSNSAVASAFIPIAGRSGVLRAVGAANTCP